MKKFSKLILHIKSESGIALILVIFILSLSTLLVTSLVYSNFLTGRSLGLARNQIQAEYLLKSTLNIAKYVMSKDATAGLDSLRDEWAQTYMNGTTLPLSSFGINISGVDVQLEISPENAKIPLGYIVDSSVLTNVQWLDVYNNLFTYLGFNQTLLEEDESKEFAGITFNSDQLVGNLIDFQDANEQTSSIRTYSGYESDLKDSKAKNQPIKNYSELSLIPGFTARRRQLLEGYATFFATTATANRIVNNTGQVNINFASEPILAIIDPINLAPFHANIQNQIMTTAPISNITSLTSLGITTATTSTLLTFSSPVVQVIAKVKYGLKDYYLKAYLDRSGGAKPTVEQVEIL